MSAQRKGSQAGLRKGTRRFALAPVAQAVALMLSTGAVVDTAHAQRAVSSNWFAAKGAVRDNMATAARLPNGLPAGSFLSPQQQSSAARQKLQTSINNLNRTAQAIAAQQAAQRAARAAALASGASVPDGLSEGGLKVDTNPLTTGWLNAQAPTQSVASGRTTVNIEQTADKAILNWETFNVGRDTTVQFQQQRNWAALNRVNDPQARPSQIQGQIKADGSILIVNRNGVVFDGGSQVNVRNLVAATANITDSQFQSNGLYSADANTASFTDALGKVEVRAGAQITTHEPGSVTDGGGYVLLLGSEVSNAGEITTRKGQAALAAGDSFIIRKGVGTDGNTYSTTRGNEVAIIRDADGVDEAGNPVPNPSGTVSNTGLILAHEGDITLAGHEVRQNGTAVATSTLSQRGTIHLLNSQSDTTGTVSLGSNAVTVVLIEQDDETALDSQRDALIKESAEQDLLRGQAGIGRYDNYSKLPDRRDQSRIEIVSGGNVVFEGDSLTLATGGQIVSDAQGRTFIADRAQVDVSGAVGVQVAMESNNVLVNVQGFELRDSPLNRDGGNLANGDIWIDRRSLVLVPAGTDGYESDRWYTANGLLEVGGYLGTQGHTIGEWAAQGGTVALAGNEVVTQAGSVVNLAGGTLDVQTGYIRQSWLRGVDGRLYAVDSAPADLAFTGLYQGYEDASARWGVTNYYYSPLIGPTRRLENGYTVGRDAGRLIISAPTAVLEGDIDASVYDGPRQTRVRDALDDGYLQAQTAVTQRASLLLGQYGTTPTYAGRVDVFDTDVRIADLDPITLDLSALDALSETRAGTLWLDAGQVNDWALGGLDLATAGTVAIEAPLVLSDGGQLALTAPVIDFAADVTARGGSIVTTNRFTGASTTTLLLDGGSSVTVDEGVTLDLRGLWVNTLLNPESSASLAWLKGGSASLTSSGDVTLAAGSLIDVSSGGAVLADGSTQGARGGNVALTASDQSAGTLTLDGEARGYGVAGGGTLSLQTGGTWVIGGEVLQNNGELAAGETARIDLILDQDLELQAGDITPIALTLSRDRFAAGETLDRDISWMNTYLALRVGEQDWVLPGTMRVYVGGTEYNGANGAVVPAGSTVTRIYNNSSLPAGYIIDPAVLPDGLSVTPYNYWLPAGSAVPQAVTLPEGTVLPAGTVYDQALAIRPLQTLAVDGLLDQGFSRYELNALQGLAVTGQTTLAPVVPTWQFNEAAQATASGADPAAVFDLVLAPLYTEDPVGAQLTQRPGADLVLGSGSGITDILTGGSLYLGESASLVVDPGREVALASGGQITVEGRIEAPGGQISIVNQRTQDDLGPGALSVWIGASAVLDAAGRAYVAQDAQGKRYGIVRDGGRITLGSLGGTNATTGNAVSSDAFVVVRPGALLDVSGAGAELNSWIAAAGRATTTGQDVLVASDGGTIAMRSYNGIYNEGMMRAASGGMGASGGGLALELESPVYGYRDMVTTVSNSLRAGRVLTVSQHEPVTTLPGNQQAGQDASTLVVGRAGVSVEQIEAGGFDSVSLLGRNAIAFDGNVTLALGRSLTLMQGKLVNTMEGSQVSLSAPYMLLDGRTNISTGLFELVPYLMPDYAGSSMLSISAGLIDVRNQVTAEFARASFASSGDLRLQAGIQTDSGPALTSLINSGDLDLSAAVVYPASGARAAIYAGAKMQTQQEGGALVWMEPSNATLTLAQAEGTASRVPWSVFGQITLSASEIVQGGTLWAPLGAIHLQTNGLTTAYGEHAATRVELLPGSLTSVSAKGLILPYGGTTDGVKYTVDGADVTKAKLITGELSDAEDDAPAIGITITSSNIISLAGSLLDVSGGGELLGAAFVSGRGGSVDALLHPRTAGGQVYALVPGVATAPVAGGYYTEWTGDVPDIGRQISVPEGVPGLAAGTYTLLPANYALMPGAYRVELGAQTLNQLGGVVSLRNGSYAFSTHTGIADTGLRDGMATAATLTPADVVRTWSHYNETRYSDFQVAQAAALGTVRPMLERDGKFLNLNLRQLAAGSESTDAPALVFEGKADFRADTHGYDGALGLLGSTATFNVTGRTTGGLVITAADSQTLRSDTLTPVSVADINAVGAPVLYVGGLPTLNSTNYADSTVAIVNKDDFSNLGSITLESGAVLRGAQVFLRTGPSGQITLGTGAGISTLGKTESALPDSSLGYQFANQGLAVSSGWIDLAAPAANLSNTVTLHDGAFLYAEGSLGFTAGGAVTIEGTPRLGARYLGLSSSVFNIGSATALAAASEAGVLPPGLAFDQTFIDKLLLGAPESGAPAAQTLTLTAADSINFLGTINLSTYDADSGESLLDQLVLNSPAIYGYGNADDTVALTTDTLVWSGSYTINTSTGTTYTTPRPGAVIDAGPGTGMGRFAIDAREIVLGFPQMAQPSSLVDINRLMLGFSDVTLAASERIVGNNTGNLSVYQSGPSPDAGYDAAAYEGTGGRLNLVTPLLSGAAGSTLTYRTGGALDVSAPAGVAASDAGGELGATLNLVGDSIRVATAVALPGGWLTLNADQDIVLDAGTQLDLSGRATPFYDLTRYSWGGDVVAESAHGNILLAEGASIDVSAPHNDAGTLQFTATDTAAGQVRLDGVLSAFSSEGYAGGSIGIRAQRIGGSAANLSSDFAALNDKLNAAGFTETRSFVLKQGNLAIGDELRAHKVTVSIDGGSLIVSGRIDASGATPGTISLAARDDLTLAGTAVLDAHGSQLQVDSYGQAINASNRGHVELTSAGGWLRLQSGATLDVSAPDGMARGQVELNAGRIGETSGDARIDAAGTVRVAGAENISLNAFWTYSPTDEPGTVVQDNGGSAPVGANGAVGLDQIDARSVQFIDAALGNAGLADRTAGLSAYGAAYHLRPGVEINSADTPSGDLTVSGDLDLSGYRYGPAANRDATSPAYGAGEAGKLVLRASGDLTINGSINDGFSRPASGLDMLLVEQDVMLDADRVIDADGLVLGNGSQLPTSGTLNFDFIAGNDGSSSFPTPTSLMPGILTPFEITMGTNVTLPEGTVVTSNVYRANGDLKWAAGTVISGNIVQRRMTIGDRLEPGFTVPSAGLSVIGMRIPAGTDLSIFSTLYAGSTELPQGALLPAGTRIAGLYDTSVPIWAAAPMLAAGSQSWSLRLASGADAGAADTRTLQALSSLDGGGAMVFSNPAQGQAGFLLPSVVRTGTGSLDLLAGGDMAQESPYGIYTAGTQLELPEGIDIATGSYVTDRGGDLTLVAQGNLAGYIYQANPNSSGYSNYAVGNWLLREGDHAAGELASWSINFGQYMGLPNAVTKNLYAFAGFGALGGGNIDVSVEGDAGTSSQASQNDGNGRAYESDGLTFAVGNSGYVTSVQTTAEGAVTGGTLVQAGGGDLNVRIGGRLNPSLQNTDSVGDDFNGSFTNTRGDIDIAAAAIGAIPLLYGMSEGNDPRGTDPYAAAMLQWGGAIGGPVLVLGDGKATLRTRGDLVLGGTGDGGMVNSTWLSFGDSDASGGWFSLWQPDTSVSLFSAGGNLTPLRLNSPSSLNERWDAYSGVSGNLSVLPAHFEAVAASGSIYYGAAYNNYSIEQAPSTSTQLSLLAWDSIYGSAVPTGSSFNPTATASVYWSMSGLHASADAIPNPFKPAVRGANNSFYTFIDASTPTSSLSDGMPSRLYAVNGDINNVLLGHTTSVRGTNNLYFPWHLPSEPVRVLAAGDIVNLGTGSSPGAYSASLIMNNDPTDVSIIQAGGSIYYLNLQVAGPGTLEVTAAGDIYQADQGSITSIGPLAEGDTRPGASIVVQAGAGAAGPDWTKLAALYLNPANQADLTPGHPLADQPGKTAHTYDEEVITWLTERYGYQGADAADALAYFASLAPEQQRVFLRQVYYAELKAGGREYNDADGPRFGSYLRGRQMIAALFPETDADGKPIERGGDYTAFGASGVQTHFGGDIQMLVPAGQIVVGAEGEVPPSTSGLITQGAGSIQLYSHASLLLGLSRIMTTFGGDILAWSAEGDINAGRGSKTTLVYTPPKRAYDNLGNVAISPQVPSSGAGIATLNPIPEIPAGDVDLIAPLGTIDAGEAGIRSSGSINVAALQVVNAANIQAQGEATGIPTVAAVNVAALTSASSAAVSAATTAQETVARARAEARQGLPSIITVRVLGFGNEELQHEGTDKPEPQSSVPYDTSSLLQVVGERRQIYPQQVSHVTKDQLRDLQQQR